MDNAVQNVDFEGLVVRLLRRLAHHIYSHSRQMVRRCGLTAPQALALNVSSEWDVFQGHVALEQRVARAVDCAPMPPAQFGLDEIPSCSRGSSIHGSSPSRYAPGTGAARGPSLYAQSHARPKRLFHSSSGTV